MTDSNKSSSGAAQNIKNKTKATAASASEEVKARAQDVADTVTTEASTYADKTKVAASQEVKGVASALRTAAEEMREGSPQERTFSQIAEGLADASDSMRDKDLGEMAGAVSDFAKRNPMVFLGTAALIGFAATRFAKASGGAASGSSDYGRQDYRSNRSGSTDRSVTSNTGNVQSPTIGTSQGEDKV